ncbi:mitogen-activated protein kinase kinase kinase 20-like [Corylus avellana]|uniref:mitogen-activated protein kinase kinase kinase 20-like n=1 Tax=Corylus avellana TaxID=13451 RepID=UPI00286D20FF|nr:mitogen-activated protein kinase kinase kinase 20-like [Corylus avellana]
MFFQDHPQPFRRYGDPPIDQNPSSSYWLGCGCPAKYTNWTKIQLLGKGSYGTVHLAICMDSYSSGESIAMKSAILDQSSSLMKEAEILKHFVDCPEIVRCFGVDFTVENGQRFFNLLLEYASGGTLLDLIKKSGGKIQENEVKKYTRMIVKGLRCMHEKGFVHCDLKPENILVFPSPDGASYVKITDFGLSKIPEDPNELITTTKFSFRGTPTYMSPESVVLGEIHGSLDIWSLGCIVVEMISGNLAWEFNDMEDLMVLIAKESPKIPETMSEIGKDFLLRCLARDPKERWTAEMLLRHPFLIETRSGTPSTRSAVCYSSAGNVLPPPGFESISRKPSIIQKYLPPPGFESISKKPLVKKYLPTPPGFSSKRILQA